MKRWASALIGLVIVVLGLAAGIYMGPVRDHAAVQGWETCTMMVITQGRPINANNEAQDVVTFVARGQHWYTKMLLPGAWPKGVKFTSWVRWRPPGISSSDPTGFRLSTVAWPIAGLATGWVLGLSLICLLGRSKRASLRPTRRDIYPRTGVA